MVAVIKIQEYGSKHSYSVSTYVNYELVAEYGSQAVVTKNS
jgi:hypothetical protein